MRVCLMIEGQEGVTWEQWLALALACEEHGLEGLFRSDHYAPIGSPPGTGSHDAWATLAAIAARTKRIRLGTLVSPVTFRHPSLLAKTAATVDHVSGGRVELGLGAGWFPPDHFTYGFPFHDAATRFAMLAEQLEIVHRSWKDDVFDFEGEHYRLEQCRAEPKPLQRPHPPVIVGGQAKRRSAELAARFADEYNTVFAGPDECRRRRERVARAFEQEGRDPGTLRFSLMTGCILGADRDEVRARAGRIGERRGHSDPQRFLESVSAEWVAGTVDEVVRLLQALEEAGVERIMLQHLAHEDLEMVALLGKEVLPRVA